MKDIIILGDIEMGAGNPTDDFISDRALSAVIKKLGKSQTPTDLILNGDTFDFLKCPVRREQRLTYPRHITEKVSLKKLALMQEAHPRVFTALRQFARGESKHIYFIIGNHDQDLFYPGVQRKIRKILGSKGNIHFGIRYSKGDVYAEHGQQYDPLNKFNPERLYLRFNDKILLNIPWIGFGLITRFMTLKEQHPFLERINPLPALFANHRTVQRKISFRGLEYFLKSVLYYPWRYYNDPTYEFPRTIMRELYNRFSNVHYEVESIVEKFKKRRVSLLKKKKILVLGHVHKKYVEEHDGWVLIHPDTWRDEYRLDTGTKMLTPKKKYYVHIKTKNGTVTDWKLVHAAIKRKKSSFAAAIKDEQAACKQARAEEGFRKKSSGYQRAMA